MYIGHYLFITVFIIFIFLIIYSIYSYLFVHTSNIITVTLFYCLTRVHMFVLNVIVCPVSLLSLHIYSFIIFLSCLFRYFVAISYFIFTSFFSIILLSRELNFYILLTFLFYNFYLIPLHLTFARILLYFNSLLFVSYNFIFLSCIS